MSGSGFLGCLTVLLSLGCGATAQPRVDPAPDAFTQGEVLFARSDYTGAMRAYEEQLADLPDDPRNDRVLLRLGMIHLVYGAPERDPERGVQRLRELSDRFPASPLREAADYVLALRQEVAALRAESEHHRQEVQKLESQIEAMKRIDLERGP